MTLRLMLVYRRARRVRSRLPPPPPSPAGDRTPGSLGGNPQISSWTSGDFRSRRRVAGEARPGRCEVVAGVPVIVSRARFGGPGLREPCTTAPCQSSGLRSVEFRDGSRVVPEYPASKLLASRRPSPGRHEVPGGRLPDRRAARSTDPPRPHPGAERRELSPRTQQESPPARGHPGVLTSPPHCRVPPLHPTA